ncbi:MAG: recombination mediator RecR [Desulfotomaculales bacterium]
MLGFAGPVARLAEELGKLPGIGPKTAQRLAFYLLKADPAVVQNLARVLLETREAIRYCSRCCNFTDTDPCSLCRDPQRDHTILCVVEEPRDVAALEKAGSFRGLYHVLHGTISPLEGRGPEDLTVRALLARLEKAEVREVILATGADVEGDATALYLARLIKPLGLKVTRLAHGLPVGADLEYADGLTLSRALEGRQEV